MNPVNRVRVLIGGVVGGGVIFAIMGLVNHFYLGNDWMQWMSTTAAMLPHPDMQRSMLLWLAASLVEGVAGVAIYAGIRPRFGPGPKTALCAGFKVWLLAYVTQLLGSKAMGFFPSRIIWGECLGGLAAALIGVFIGAAIYKE
jgi:hypothetical protein